MRPTMKRQLILLLLVICMIPVTAYANVSTCTVTQEYTDGGITVTGALEPGTSPAYLTLRVLKEGYSFDDLTEENELLVTEYMDQVNLEEGETNFALSFVLGGSSRTLAAQIGGEGFSSPYDLQIEYMDPSDFRDAVDAVNAAAGSYESFAQACGTDNRMKKLGFTYKIQGVETDAALRILYDSIKGGNPPLDREDAEGAANRWKAATLAAALNQNLSLTLSEQQECVKYFGDPIVKWVRFVCEDADKAAEARLRGLLSGRNYAALDDLGKRLKEALVLTVVEYPSDGNGNIGLILKDFSEITGITVNTENKIYGQMAGTRYDSLAQLLNAYQELKSSGSAPSSPGSSPSGGSSGGSGRGTGGSGSKVAVSSDGTGYTPNEPINMKFIDLDTVSWAYEAISTLTDRGIINGISDTLFAPLDTITREAFVKLLVCAAGYETRGYTGGRFADVAETEWYAPYVNIAAETGIVTGIEENRFGVGDNISRQDMAVVIYRILKGKGISLESGDLTFDDADQVAEYAREAVAALSAAGAVNGVGDNLFDPTGTATRAEAAQIIFNVIDQIGA